MSKLFFWLIGLLSCVFISNFLPNIIVRNLKKLPYRRSLTCILGFFEILIYAISWISGFSYFIVIWLGIKTAGRWVPHKTPQAITNTFLIGNLLSVLVGVYLGAIFKSYLVDMGLIEVFRKNFFPG